MIPGAVSVGFLHPGKLSFCFHEALTALLFFDAQGPQRIVSHDYGQLAKNCPPTGIVAGRNTLARMMCDKSQAEWLFMVDSDMAYDPDIVERLIAAADPIERPVVGGLCFAQKTDGKASLGGVRYRAVPTVYAWFEDDKEAGFVPIFDYTRDSMMEAAGTGGACLLIHRSVFEKMRVKFGDTWFDQANHPKHKTHFSEDLSFCVRLAACDIPLHIHTGIKTGHDKGSQFLDEEFYLAQRTKGGVEGTIDVLIPTLGRAERIKGIFNNVRETTLNQHRVVFVVEAHDQSSIDAVKALGLEPVINQRSSNYAGAINTAYRQSTADWVFAGADDIDFTFGWDAECLNKTADWFTAIGTNDLFNNRVLQGIHATHYLVNRRYLDTHGGVLDEGPGSFLHEGYDHNYTDTEFIETMKARTRFAPCLTAIVEHKHVLAGKADMDAGYEKSMAHYDQDAALFADRKKLWT